MPDCAIFADTKWEPMAVYTHLSRLESILPFPVYRVSAGDIRQDTIDNKFSPIPRFVLRDGKIGMGRRNCTSDYKLKPIRRKCVELTGGRKAGSVNMWIGISTDEAHRMKPSRVKYINNEYPLIDKRMSRKDCKKWLDNNGFGDTPKSSCIGCPFHSDSQWRSLTKDEFDDACYVDEMIRDKWGKEARQFLHKTCYPLREIDFRSLEDMGQLDLFGNECEGMCGV